MTIKRALHTRILAAASLVVLLALALAPVRARAADAIDPTQTGSLTVVCEHEGVKLRNVRVNIWRVAELSATGHATLVDPFDAYSVSLDQDDTVGWSGAAYTLAGYAARDEISPTASQSSNSEGVATFSGLKPGMYLVVMGASAHHQGGLCYTFEPTLVTVPQLVDDAWEYDATVELKFSEHEIPSDVIDVTVIKQWADDDAPNRPTYVDVQLLGDGKVVDEQRLSADNGWTHTWTDLDPTVWWTVVEREVPASYDVIVGQGGNNTFVITNSTEKPPLTPDTPDTPDNPNTPDTPTTPDTPGGPKTPSTDKRLPQTGTTWYLVPPLALVGMVVFGVGFYLRSRSK